MGRPSAPQLVPGLADAEWNFGSIPAADVENVAKFEYCRESKILINMVFWDELHGQGFAGTPRYPHQIIDLWDHLPLGCVNWNYLEKNPKTLLSPWLELSAEAQEHLRRTWITKPCKIVSWRDLERIVKRFEPDTAEHWRDTHVNGDEPLIELQNAMRANSSFHVRNDNRELVAFEVDWNRFDKYEMADEIRRQFLMVFERPPGLPDLPQPSKHDYIALRALAVARLRKAGLRNHGRICEIGKQCNYRELAQLTHSEYQNHRRDILRAYYRFHPFLKKEAVLVEDNFKMFDSFRWPASSEIPWCLSKDKLRPTPS